MTIVNDAFYFKLYLMFSKYIDVITVYPNAVLIPKVFN